MALKCEVKFTHPRRFFKKNLVSIRTYLDDINMLKTDHVNLI